MGKKIPQLIVALDVEDRNRAVELVDELGDAVSFFKVGSRLFTAFGPSIVEEIKSRGADVFLDLKFHDIPATVAGSVRAALSIGVDMMTLHASGGADMLRAAVEAVEEMEAMRAGSEGGKGKGRSEIELSAEARAAAVSRAVEPAASRPILLGVTVLTSLSRQNLSEIYSYDGTIEDLVLRLVELSVGSGLDGVVSSVREAAAIRERFGERVVIVTPGIRFANADRDDQKRIAAPKDAVSAGSDYIVVGRPIIRAASPLEAAERMLAELKAAAT